MKKDIWKWDADEEEACLKLANLSGVGNLSVFRLLEYAGNAQEALRLSEEEVNKLLDKRSAKAFLKAREEACCILPAEFRRRYGMNFVPWLSPEYPRRLRNIPDPPFMLYIKGELPKEELPSVAIIGARACSEYGKAVAAEFGRSLGGRGIRIISGMARGIDGIAQQASLQAGGKSYAVLGCGADVCYPPENARLYEDLCVTGGIVSEYPPGTEAKSGFFPMRNRIISGLADILVVIEARKRSGTYITVTRALEQGKDVYVVPGRITDALSEGCNYLLSQGAGVATSPEIIVQALAESGYGRYTGKQSGDGDVQNAKEKWSAKSTAGDGSRNAILKHLDVMPTELQRVYETVSEETGMSYADFMLEITKMQIAGLVVGEGNYFHRNGAL